MKVQTTTENVANLLYYQISSLHFSIYKVNRKVLYRFRVRTTKIESTCAQDTGI